MLTLLLFACAGDPEAGAEIYVEACGSCHGEAGDLDLVYNGVQAAILGDRVPALTDATLVSILVDGTGAMPPTGLDDAEARDCIAWLREAFPE